MKQEENFFTGGCIPMNNIYPPWWNQTITIYNRYEDDHTNLVRWYKTIVSGCFYKDAGNKIQVGNTVIETNDIICRIRKDDRFLPNYEWNAKPADQKQDYFTLSVGDIIVLGEVADDIDEYHSGMRSNDIIDKYKALQGCFKIEQVADNTGGGRGSEHYYAKGV